MKHGYRIPGTSIFWDTDKMIIIGPKPRLRFVVRCRLGYYGPDPEAKGHNLGDLPLEKAYRYTRREARDLAGNLGAEVEEIVGEILA